MRDTSEPIEAENALCCIKNNGLVDPPIDADPAQRGLGGRTDLHLRRTDNRECIRVAQDIIGDPRHF